MQFIINYLCGIAIIYSASLYKSSKNAKKRIIKKIEGMVISWFWNMVGSLFINLYCRPRVFNRIKRISILCVIIIVNSSENNDSVFKNSWLVMRQLSRCSSFAVNLLPWYSVLRIINEALDARYAQSPHIGHWALLNISSSMNVKVLIYNETAMIRSSLWQLSRQADLIPINL